MARFLKPRADNDGPNRGPGTNTVEGLSLHTSLPEQPRPHHRRSRGSDSASPSAHDDNPPAARRGPEASPELDGAGLDLGTASARVVRLAQRVVDAAAEPVSWPGDRPTTQRDGPAATRSRPGGDADVTEPRLEPGRVTELAIAEAPRSVDDVLAAVERRIWRSGVNTRSPGYLGYLPAGGLHTSALGSYLGAVINPYSAMRDLSPGAADLEDVVVGWLCDVVGLPTGAGGTLTSGGSSATLAAVVAAREWMHVDPAHGHRHPVYVGEHRHHSVDRALRFAGLAGCPLRVVPSGPAHRMDPKALEFAIAADVAAGLRPWLVVPTAGTTSSGSIDPLAGVLEVARRAGTWVHVDAAYGGLFALSDVARPRLAVLGEADSVTVDPHKALFLPYGTGALLARDPSILAAAFAHDAAYLEAPFPPASDRAALAEQRAQAPQPHRRPRDSWQPADLGLELTRPFRAMGVWLPLQINGVGAFRTAMTQRLRLARWLHRELEASPHLSVGPEPDLTVVTYRVATSGRRSPEDEDRLTRALAARLNDSGSIFVSTTVLDGRVTLRAAIGSAYTTSDDVAAAADLILTTAAALADT